VELRHIVVQSSLFPYAKIAENHVQNILNVNPPREPAQSPTGQPELLSNEFLSVGRMFGQCPIQGLGCLLQGPPVPFPRDQGTFNWLEKAGCICRKLIH